MDRFDPVISGLSITNVTSQDGTGTIGCFIKADGKVKKVPSGNYLLTCAHVVVEPEKLCDNDPGEQVIQPGCVTGDIPEDYQLGTVVRYFFNSSRDCAIVRLDSGRQFKNEVPNHPLRWGNRALNGFAQAQVGDVVYKYGAATRHTMGVVTETGATVMESDQVLLDNVTIIKSQDGGEWVEPGDSGSVVIRYSDDAVLGLNAGSIPDSADKRPAYKEWYAYDIATQISLFSGIVELAKPVTG